MRAGKNVLVLPPFLYFFQQGKTGSLAGARVLFSRCFTGCQKRRLSTLFKVTKIRNFEQNFLRTHHAIKPMVPIFEPVAQIEEPKSGSTDPPSHVVLFANLLWPTVFMFTGLPGCHNVMRERMNVWLRIFTGKWMRSTLLPEQEVPRPLLRSPRLTANRMLYRVSSRQAGFY